MNQDSSRSHSIFTITVEKLQQGDGKVSCLPHTTITWPFVKKADRQGPLAGGAGWGERQLRGNRRAVYAALLCNLTHTTIM